MTPVNLHIQSKHYIPCPDCGSLDSFRIDHLFGSKKESFGPWTCDECGIYIKGVIESDNKVSIKILDRPRSKSGLMLVRLTYDGREEENKRPIYFIFENRIYSDWIDEDGNIKSDLFHYWVNEQTCPTNISKNLAIIEGTDIDPHGIFEFVQIIEKPKDFKSHEYNSYYDWVKIFSELGNDIVDINAVSLSGD